VHYLNFLQDLEQLVMTSLEEAQVQDGQGVSLGGLNSNGRMTLLVQEYGSSFATAAAPFHQ